MIFKVLEASKWGSFKVVDINGTTVYAKPSKKVTTPMEIGKTYEGKLWKPEDKKTTYITEAALSDDEVTVEPKAAPRAEQKAVPKVTSKATDKVTKPDPDKMSKADWAKKDDGIKWLACVKAAAEFNARRPDSTIVHVINDASSLFKAEAGGYIKDVNEVDYPEAKEKDIFEENGI